MPSAHPCFLERLTLSMLLLEIYLCPFLWDSSLLLLSGYLWPFLLRLLWGSSSSSSSGLCPTPCTFLPEEFPGPLMDVTHVNGHPPMSPILPCDSSRALHQGGERYEVCPLGCEPMSCGGHRETKDTQLFKVLAISI